MLPGAVMLPLAFSAKLAAWNEYSNRLWNEADKGFFRRNWREICARLR